VLRKIVVGLLGFTGTLVVLLLVTVMLQQMPMPDASGLGIRYWQDQPSGGGFVSALTRQLGFAAFMLMNMWVLWFIPLGGLLLTLVLMNREVDSSEMAVYLERIHLLEHALTEARTNAELYGGRWDGLNSKFDQLFEHSAEVWLVVDRGGGIRRWNRAAVDLARRFTPGVGDSLEGKPLSDVVANAADLSTLTAPVRDALMQGLVTNGEVHLQQVGQHFLVWIFPLGDDVALVLRDVTHRYRDDAFMRSSERLVRQLVEDSVRPVAVLDMNWTYLYVSRKWSDVMGLDPHEGLIGSDHRVKVPDFPADRRVIEPQLQEGKRVGRDDERRTVKGREMLLSWHIRPWADAAGRPGGYIFTVLDTTEHTRLKQQVAQAEERENALAYSDALTGLPNRQLFNDRLNMNLAQAYRQLGKVALFFLDLDGFKAVNDQLGHDAGDLLLKQVADRLKGCVRTTDTVARLGGDEFTIILSIRDRADAEQVAEKVLNTIRAPYDLNGKIADKVGTSIGIALYPQDGTQGADLVRKADAAMYAAKQGGKNAWRFATQEITVQG